MKSAVVPIHNGRAFPRARIPRLGMADFRRTVIGLTRTGARVSALIGIPTGEKLEFLAVLASDSEGLLSLVGTEPEGETWPSMTSECPQVHLFEREIAEQWGVIPEGHPWLKPVRYVGSHRLGPDGRSRPASQQPTVGVMDYYRVEGEEIHEVAVGPVHAGVIEPGHFRFQCHGEQVLHLEISLGYQHRGVERATLGGPDKRTIHYAETLAGDTTVGHALAYCQIHEALSNTAVPARAQALRGVALELERLANHTGNLGALAGDVGFLPTASYCGRLRGEFLNLTAQVCGSRFGRGMVRPGGVGFDVEPGLVAAILKSLDGAARDVESAVELLWSTASVQARFEETGVVTAEAARELGLVGPVARSCGLARDVRQDLPTGIFRFAQIPTSVWHSGDVFARAYVRWMEIQRSIAFVRQQLRTLPKGPVRVAPGPLAALRACVSLVEGTRGEICHVAMTDSEGRFAVYKVVDPSFHNWSGLAVAMRDQQISDFPLCNKSFDLSYCGFDL